MSEATRITPAATSYVFQTPEGGWRIVGTRVSLDSVVYEYVDGEPPEAIVAHYPALTLEQVRGAIAHYLRHRDEIDAYLVAQDKFAARLREQTRSHNADLLNRMKERRASAADASGQR